MGTDSAGGGPEVADSGPTRSWTPERIERLLEVSPWIVGLVFWQLLSWIANDVPGPADVANFLFTEVSGTELLDGVLTTSARFWSGMGLSLIVGVSLGLLLGGSAVGRGLFRDPTIAALALPSFIWSLLGAMWFGAGWQAPVMTAVLVAFPFIAINVAEGVESVSPDLRRMSRAYGVRRAKQIRNVYLPAVVGSIVAGFRIGVIVGWNGVLITEFFAGDAGLGFQAHVWYTVPSFEGFLALTVVFVLYIVIVDRLLVEPLYRHTQRWRRDAPARGGEKPSAPIMSDGDALSHAGVAGR